MLCMAVAAVLALAHVVPLFAWGEPGHYLTGQAAAARIPADMPAFFRAAAAQLAYLNPEPDRWRARAEFVLDPALHGGSAPDHYVDMDMIAPDVFAAAFTAPQRYAYADTLRSRGVDAPKFGFLPFRILELTQRLREEFRLWRSAPNDQTREWIQARVINDAGILGHDVADGSDPLHTTIQFTAGSAIIPTATPLISVGIRASSLSMCKRISRSATCCPWSIRYRARFPSAISAPRSWRI